MAAERPSSPTVASARDADVDIVIVTFSSRRRIRACLDAVRPLVAAGRATVTVVENASGDGTADVVRREYPEVTVVENDRNAGFSVANNIGIRLGSARYVLALNPDTRVPHDGIERLVALMDDLADVGVCGCRLVREDGSFDHAARRAFPTVLGALGHFTGLGRGDSAPRRLAQYRAVDVEAGRVDAVNGAFMLIRRRALEDVGLFDEGYWMYMEDLDLCYRFREAGWTTWYEPSVTAVHAKGASADRARSIRLTFAFHYGMYRFYRSHYAHASNPVTNAVVYGGIAAKLVIAFARGGGRRFDALRVRRRLARTRGGYQVKRVLRAHVPSLRDPSHPPVPRVVNGPIRNVLLVSHGDFETNSGMHVRAIALGLADRGYEIAVALPGARRREGAPTTVTHRDATAGRLPFSPDLVHAFSPRAAVRRVVHAVGRPYVVHLEDDDSRIEGGTPPVDREAFVAGAVGMSVVIERLLEFAPEGLPTAVAWPGFDESVIGSADDRPYVRRELGVSAEDIVIVYPGNIQETNLAPMRELYRAIAMLRAEGIPAVLVKTGWTFVPDAYLPRLGDGLRDLGWVAHARVGEILAASDVLVQPGSPGGFDDYRFPSKLPEFLAAGKPVILPRTNIGLYLEDGLDALLLSHGSAEEIRRQVARLATDAALRDALGRNGSRFARQRLRWSDACSAVARLYDAVAAASASA